MVPFLLMIFFWTVLRRQEELWAHVFTCFRSGEKLALGGESYSPHEYWHDYDEAGGIRNFETNLIGVMSRN